MNHHYLQTTAPIKLASPNLTRLYGELDKQTAAAKACDAEYWRLAKILRPDILDRTSVVYLEPTKVAVLGIVEPKVHRNTETGGDATEAARRADDINRIARGEPLVEVPDVQSRLNHEARKRGAIEVVIEDLEKQIREERRTLAIAYCKTLKPKSDDQMKRFRKTLAEAHAVHLEIMNMRQDLLASDIGFYGLDVLDPDFLRSTAAFLQDASSRGYLA
jgi:hypothetical protein